MLDITPNWFYDLLGKNTGVDAVQRTQKGNLSFELEIWADFHPEQEIINKQLQTNIFWMFSKGDLMHMQGLWNRVFKLRDLKGPQFKPKQKRNSQMADSNLLKLGCGNSRRM